MSSSQNQNALLKSADRGGVNKVNRDGKAMTESQWRINAASSAHATSSAEKSARVILQDDTALMMHSELYHQGAGGNKKSAEEITRGSKYRKKKYFVANESVGTDSVKDVPLNDSDSQIDQDKSEPEQMMPEAESETQNRPVASSAHKTSEVDSEEEDAQSF